MSETKQHAAVETFVQTLDTMAFIPSEPIDVALAEPPNDAVLVTLSFTGPTSGTLELVASRQFARLLAANVVAGAMMPQIADSENDVFSLSLPTLQRFNTERNWREFADHAFVLNADGQTIALRLVV
ncbi:MAG TPA: hypothetical protein PKB10_09730 [Tepidisphaeraceae bacterium]|nr:hypothetical protein [Tepidisphaeraceae bacterium]